MAVTKDSAVIQVSVSVAGVSLPGSPVTVSVVAGGPCADASIPSVLPPPFQQCDALSSPAGAGLVFDIAMRDCLGNPTALADAQVCHLLCCSYMRR